MTSVTGHKDEPNERDQLTVTKLTCTARWHAARREPTPEELIAAVAELREIAGPRRDLLAEAAGLLTGFYRGTPEESRARTAARYCRAAGADPGLLPWWVEEGQRRASCARQESDRTYLGVLGWAS
ncbi:MAG: hypothetical protein M3Z75_12515 [Actinomycetota bacterium]|nr:hypothetical protein [Actinomycetota bacterium]